MANERRSARATQAKRSKGGPDTGDAAGTGTAAGGDPPGRAAASNQHLQVIVEGIFHALGAAEEPRLARYYSWGDTTLHPAGAPRLEMPITRDMTGRSGLDIVLGVAVHEKRLAPRLYHLPGDKAGKEGKEAKGPSTECASAAFASCIFAAIAPYGFMHSGPVVAGAIAKAVTAEVPSIYAFLAARFKTPAHCPGAMAPELLRDVRQRATPGAATTVAYAALPFDPWVRHAEVSRAFFEGEIVEKPGASGKPLQPYSLRFYDIPWLHEDCREG